MIGFRYIQSYIKISMMTQRPPKNNPTTKSRNYVETEQK